MPRGEMWGLLWEVKPGRQEKVHKAWETSQESSLESSQKPNSCFNYIRESLPGIVVNNLTLAIMSCPCFILTQPDSLLVGAVRIRSKLQQVQNFSGVCWPVGSRKML